MAFLVKFNRFLSNLQLQLIKLTEPHHPALCYNLAALEPSPKSQPPSFLDSLMDGFLWAAVPKRRRSRERRIIRRNGFTGVSKYMTPKRNIRACLECGQWHEAHTLCGNCYSKVREETKVMRDSMDADEYRYNIPQTEVAYVYQGESKDDMADKRVVEIDKPRPEWFSKNLLTKGRGKRE